MARNIVLIICLTLFLVLSCRTVLKTPEPFDDAINSLPLEPGASAYVIADVKGARPVLDLLALPGMNQEQAALVLDRMNSMAIALYPEGSGRRIQLAAWGNVSSSHGGLVFGMNRDWEKTRCAAGHSYWYSKKDGLSVATGVKQAFAAQYAAGLPLDPVTHSSGVELPDGFHDFSRGTVIFCWMEDPGPAIKRIMDGMGIPLTLPAERVFISLFAAEENADTTPESLPRYEALLRIETSSESDARTLLRLISLAHTFSGGASTDAKLSLMELLLSNAPVQEGRFIRIKTPRMSAEDIAGLIRQLTINK